MSDNEKHLDDERNINKEINRDDSIMSINSQIKEKGKHGPCGFLSNNDKPLYDERNINKEHIDGLERNINWRTLIEDSFNKKVVNLSSV